MTQNLRDPWLVAIWPGMGSVAVGAGEFLRQHLDAELLEELPTTDFFDVEKVEIQSGVARVPWVPGCRLYGWHNPDGRDLLIFVGEQQPSRRGYDFCRILLEAARRHGVRRVFTFAAMATPIHPTADPRVFAVANEAALLVELQELPVAVLGEGHISGLNGVLLAAAAEHELEGFCLLGEIPIIAVGVPNPKASCQVLEVFSTLSGIPLDLSPLAGQIGAVEAHLLELLERMKPGLEGEVEIDDAPDFGASLPDLTSLTSEPPEVSSDLSSEITPDISTGDRVRIERLFELAAGNRQKAYELKGELDRLGIFEEYEDRFLDLFRS